MNSTSVPSNDNQKSNTDITLIATNIVDREKKNEFKMISGDNNRVNGLVDYLQQYNGPEIVAEAGQLREDGMLVTNNSTIAMKYGSKAYKNVVNNNEKRNKLHNRAKNAEKASVGSER